MSSLPFSHAGDGGRAHALDAVHALPTHGTAVACQLLAALRALSQRWAVATMQLT